ncbi:hypothetical protein [Streptomyces sp. NPDC048516]|uniref:hypothetical protein n=1 Tax=Streptomyces sp. NPDC048516 TaxID=3365565 RepID=UPI00371D5E7F
MGYFDDDSLTVYQSKRWKSFTADDLSDAVRMYAEGTCPFDATRFVLVTTAYVGDTAVEDRLHQLRTDYHSLDIELWGPQQLSDMLFPQRSLVARFFGPTTAEVFCVGDPKPAPQHTPSMVGSPIRDFTDPFALEVHRVIEAEEGGLGDRPTLLPPYISREHDIEVGKLLAWVAAEQSACWPCSLANPPRARHEHAGKPFSHCPTTGGSGIRLPGAQRRRSSPACSPSGRGP